MLENLTVQAAGRSFNGDNELNSELIILFN